MPSRTNSRAANNARNDILEMLKDDHKRVKKAYRDFLKLDREEDPEGCAALVRQVLSDLEVHATLEEELLYPAARNAIGSPDLIDEAEVEHASAKALIQQLKGMDGEDDKFAAHFTVLCEYVLHHVKEEEGELFPQLQSVRLDWETMAHEMLARRAELTAVEDGASEATAGKDTADDDSERAAAPRAARKTSGGARTRSAAADGMVSAPGEAIDSRRV